MIDLKRAVRLGLWTQGLFTDDDEFSVLYIDIDGVGWIEVPMQMRAFFREELRELLDIGDFEEDYVTIFDPLPFVDLDHLEALLTRGDEYVYSIAQHA